MKNKLILDPLWLIDNPRCYLDEEYQSYKLAATQNKFKNQIENNNTFNFIELLIHWINTQCLVTDECIYNKKFQEISIENTQLKNIIGEIKNDFMNNSDNSPIINILENAEYTFAELIQKSIEQENKTLSYIDFKQFNKAIHTQEDIFILYNVSYCDVYEVWRLSFKDNYNLNHIIEKIGSYTYQKSEVPNLINYIKQTYQVDYDSICIAKTDKAIGSKKVINSIRNILTANKILNIYGEFTKNVLQRIYNNYFSEQELVKS